MPNASPEAFVENAGYQRVRICGPNGSITLPASDVDVNPDRTVRQFVIGRHVTNLQEDKPAVYPIYPGNPYQVIFGFALPPRSP